MKKWFKELLLDIYTTLYYLLIVMLMLWIVYGIAPGTYINEKKAEQHMMEFNTNTRKRVESLEWNMQQIDEELAVLRNAVTAGEDIVR